MALRVVNVHEAKTHLSRLLQDVEEGAEIVIARNGKPIVRMVSIAGQPQRERELGFLQAAPDVDLSLEAIETGWDDEDWAQWEREQDEYFGPATNAHPA